MERTEKTIKVQTVNFGKSYFTVVTDGEETTIHGVDSQNDIRNNIELFLNVCTMVKAIAAKIWADQNDPNTIAACGYNFNPHDSATKGIISIEDV